MRPNPIKEMHTMKKILVFAKKILYYFIPGFLHWFYLSFLDWNKYLDYNKAAYKRFISRFPDFYEGYLDPSFSSHIFHFFFISPISCCFHWFLAGVIIVWIGSYIDRLIPIYTHNSIFKKIRYLFVISIGSLFLFLYENSFHSVHSPLHDFACFAIPVVLLTYFFAMNYTIIKRKNIQSKNFENSK